MNRLPGLRRRTVTPWPEMQVGRPRDIENRLALITYHPGGTDQMSACRRWATLLPVLVAFCFGGVLYADSDFVKVLLDRGHAGIPAADLVTAHGGRGVEEYDDFRLVELPASAVAAFREQLRTLGMEAREAPEFDTVELPKRKIDTRTRNQKSVEESPSARLYVVQFRGPIKEDWLTAVGTSGLKVVSYLPFNSLVVFGPPKGLNTLARSPFVEWVDRYQADDKGFTVRSDSGTVTLDILFVAGDEAYELLRRLWGESWQTVVLSQEVLGGRLRVRAPFDASVAASLLAEECVINVEEAGRDSLSSEREGSALSTTSTTPPAGGSYLNWLISRSIDTTSSYRIAVADTGLCDGSDQPTGLHPVFATPTDKIAAWFSHDTTSQARFGRDFDGHGTMVAGMALGEQVSGTTDPNGYFRGLGAAPRTKLIVQRIFFGTFNQAGTIDQWLSKAKELQAYIQTQSRNTVPTGDSGYYANEDVAYDTAIRQRDLPVTVSTGNLYPPTHPNGWGNTPRLWSPANAKNVISVGGAEGYRPGYASTCPNSGSATPNEWLKAGGFANVAYLSRRGTLDARIKPDILLPATLISSATPFTGGRRTWCENTTDNRYAISSGTSFASPQAAAALVLLAKRKGLSPTAPLSAAMAKAALIGNATGLAGTDGYSGDCPNPSVPCRSVLGRPDATTGQGWGRVTLTSTDQEQYVDGKLSGVGFAAPFTAVGTSRTATFTIKNSGKPVFAVLAWSDPAGNPGSGRTLVNDLNLKIRTNCALQNRDFIGNFFASGNGSSVNCCAFSATYDNRNNVEAIQIPANYGVSTFTLTVELVSGAVSSSDPQPFALYVRNACSTANCN